MAIPSNTSPTQDCSEYRFSDDLSLTACSALVNALGSDSPHADLIIDVDVGGFGFRHDPIPFAHISLLSPAVSLFIGLRNSSPAFIRIHVFLSSGSRSPRGIPSHDPPCTPGTGRAGFPRSSESIRNSPYSEGSCRHCRVTALSIRRHQGRDREPGKLLSEVLDVAERRLVIVPDHVHTGTRNNPAICESEYLFVSRNWLSSLVSEIFSIVFPSSRMANLVPVPGRTVGVFPTAS